VPQQALSSEDGGARESRKPKPLQRSKDRLIGGERYERVFTSPLHRKNGCGGLLARPGAADAKKPQDCYEAKPRKIVHLIFASKGPTGSTYRYDYQ
jgi:hypothetical protein